MQFTSSFCPKDSCGEPFLRQDKLREESVNRFFIPLEGGTQNDSCWMNSVSCRVSNFGFAAYIGEVILNGVLRQNLVAHLINSVKNLQLQETNRFFTAF